MTLVKDNDAGKAWARYLGTLPPTERAVAERFPPTSRWQLATEDGRTYYMADGVLGNGTLVMTRYLAVEDKAHGLKPGTPVQVLTGVSPDVLIPWVEPGKRPA